MVYCLETGRLLSRDPLRKHSLATNRKVSSYYCNGNLLLLKAIRMLLLKYKNILFYSINNQIDSGFHGSLTKVVLHTASIKVNNTPTRFL